MNTDLPKLEVRGIFPVSLRVISLEILLRSYVQQEFFSTREVCWNSGTSINTSSVAHERKARQRKISEFFLLDTLEAAFQMRNLTR